MLEVGDNMEPTKRCLVESGFAGISPAHRSISKFHRDKRKIFRAKYLLQPKEGLVYFCFSILNGMELCFQRTKLNLLICKSKSFILGFLSI